MADFFCSFPSHFPKGLTCKLTKIFFTCFITNGRNKKFLSPSHRNIAKSTHKDYLTLTLSYSHTLTHIHTLIHTHIHTHTYTSTHTLFHTHNVLLVFSFLLYLWHTHTHTRTNTYTHNVLLVFSFLLSLSHTHTHAQTHTQSLSVCTESFLCRINYFL